jgi:STE24 endopeptidase
MPSRAGASAGRTPTPSRRPAKGQAYASALTRLANQNLAEVDPEPWVEFLLYSHPALGKRIEMAEKYS